MCSSQSSRTLELDAAYLQTKARGRKSKRIDKKEWSYKNQKPAGSGIVKTVTEVIFKYEVTIFHYTDRP